MVDPITAIITTVGLIALAGTAYGLYQAGFRKARSPDYIVDMREVANYNVQKHRVDE